MTARTTRSKAARRAIAGACAVAAAFTLVEGCRSPTEITFVVTTNEPCTSVKGTSISVASLAALADQPSTTTTTFCDNGQIGSLVVVPSGSKDAEVAVRVVMGLDGKSPDACVADNYAGGCIVARRAVHFIPQTPLDVPIAMEVACENVSCSDERTCDKGACVTVQTACTGGTCDLAAASVGDDAGGASDSSVGADGSAARSDATLVVDGPLESGPPGPPPALQTIASVGSIPAETGTAQQHHVVYAQNSGRWWVFTLDDVDPLEIKAQWSTDFVTWTPAQGAGAVLTLAEPWLSEGRDLDVAYANLNGQDVVHLAISHYDYSDTPSDNRRDVFRARATITGSAIAFGPELRVNAYTNMGDPSVPPDTVDPDGCVIAVAGDGRVYEASGEYNDYAAVGDQFDTGNDTDVFESSIADVGAASWAPTMTHLASEWVHGVDYGRALVPVDTSSVLALWPSSIAQNVFYPVATYENLYWGLFTKTSTPMSSNALVFAGPGDDDAGTLYAGPQDSTHGPAQEADQNDWSVCAANASLVHAVRRKLDGGANDVFEHAVFSTTAGAWARGGAIPNDPGIQGTGVVVLTNGTKLALFAIATDGSIRVNHGDGVSWGSWSTLFPAGSAPRAYLSGSNCNDHAHAALLWTEGSGSAFRLVGSDVSGVF